MHERGLQESCRMPDMYEQRPCLRPLLRLLLHELHELCGFSVRDKSVLRRYF
jgi:hypothetical protein